MCTGCKRRGGGMNRTGTPYDARICPNCGARTGIYWATIRKVGWVRYRKCDRCKYTYKTIEILLDDYETMTEVEQDDAE